MRARNIKPSFFTNDTLAECEPLSRILFIGLWTLSDREGRLEDRPKKIKAEVLPYDDCDADSLLQQLQDHGFILRYHAAGNKYIQVLKFNKHQQPHYKEVESVIPVPQNWTDSGVTAGGVSESVRIKILNRDGKCLKCHSKDDLTLDHIIPRALGGSHDESNLQTLCRKCNSSKNNRLLSSAQGRANIEPSRLPVDLPLTDSPFPLPEPPTVRAPGFFEKCFQLATAHFPKLTSSNTASIHAWQEAGYDFDLHVKPVLDSCKAKGSTPRGFNFFTPAIEDSAKLKVKPVPVKEKPKQLTPEEIEKNREFFKRTGMQHPIYNPEGIRA